MIITLTTDFGTQDPFVGIMKGVILKIAPDVRLVDITHELPPQDVTAGALVMESLVDYFPAGAIHLAVVDPTVGGPRHAVAVRTQNCTFIGPDNGLFTAALARAPMIAAVALTNRHYHLHPTSATFHGRDIFAPAAAHLAAGTALADLGEPVTQMLRLDLPTPQLRDTDIEAHVVHVDRFGNLITDLTAAEWRHWMGDGFDDRIQVQLLDTTIHGLHRTFVEVKEGEPVAYFGSTGRLEIAVRNGSAAARFDCREGAAIRLQRLSAAADAGASS